MSKHTHIAVAVAATLMALATAVPMNAHAQGRDELNSGIVSDIFAQSDREGGLKQALKLSAEQEKLWVPAEEALRSLQEQRRAFRSAMTEAEPTDQMERLRRRAELMAQRASALNKVTDTVQPLWATFSEEQKRVLAQSLSLAGRSDHQHRMSRNEDDDRNMRYRDRGRSPRYDDGDRWYRHRGDQDSGGWRDRRNPMMSGRDEDDDDDRDVRVDRFDRYSRRWSHDDYPTRERRFRLDRYDHDRRGDRDYCRCDRRD
jgi:hypothetical protein